jgi:hypothetical protein
MSHLKDLLIAGFTFSVFVIGISEALIDYLRCCLVLKRILPITKINRLAFKANNILIAGSGPSLADTYQNDVRLWKNSFKFGTVWTLLLRMPPELIFIEAIAKSHSIKQIIQNFAQHNNLNACHNVEISIKQCRDIEYYKQELRECIRLPCVHVSYSFTISLHCQSIINWLPGTVPFSMLSFFQALLIRLGFLITFQAGTSMSTILSYLNAIKTISHHQPTIITTGIDLYSSEYFFQIIPSSCLINSDPTFLSSLHSGHIDQSLTHSTNNYKNPLRRLTNVFYLYNIHFSNRILKYSSNSLLPLDLWCK